MKDALVVVLALVVWWAPSVAMLPSDAELLGEAERAVSEHFSLLDSRMSGRARSWVRTVEESAILCSSDEETTWTAQCLVVGRERNTWTASWSTGTSLLVSLREGSQPVVETPDWQPPLSGEHEAWSDTSAAMWEAFNAADGRRNIAIEAVGRSPLMRRIVAESPYGEWVETGRQALMLQDDPMASRFVVAELLRHPIDKRTCVSSMAMVTVSLEGHVYLAPVFLFGPEADPLLVQFMPELRPQWGADAGSAGAPILYVYLEYGMGNILDTYAGTFTKDMVAGRDTTVALALTPKEQGVVLQAAEALGFFQYPLFLGRKSIAGVIEPDAGPSILRLRAAERDNSVAWTYLNGNSSYVHGVRDIEQLIQGIVEEKEA